MNTKVLINSLYIFFRLGFWISSAFTVIMILGMSSQLILKKNNLIEKVRFTQEIPVTIQINQKDSITKNSITTIRKFNFLNKSEDENLFKLLKPRTIIKTNLDITSEKTWLSTVLISYHFLKLICISLLFFLLKEIFNNLKKDFNFNLVVSSNVKKLGLLLILITLTSLVFSIIIYFSFDVATITSEINKIINLDNLTLYIKPRISFTIWNLLIGVSLLILNKLLLKGREMKKENELTI